MIMKLQCWGVSCFVKEMLKVVILKKINGVLDVIFAFNVN